jgi:hypothetical protein
MNHYGMIKKAEIKTIPDEIEGEEDAQVIENKTNQDSSIFKR